MVLRAFQHLFIALIAINGTNYLLLSLHSKAERL